MSKDTIYRQEAIDEFWKLDIEMRPSAIDAITGILEQLPSAQPEITDEQAIEHLRSTGWMQNHDREMYDMGLKKQLADDSGSYDSLLPSAQPETPIMTVTVKPDELVGFVEWVLDEIWDEELWEYNWQAFPELVCRKLLKLGFVTTNEEGNYERNE